MTHRTRSVGRLWTLAVALAILGSSPLTLRSATTSTVNDSVRLDELVRQLGAKEYVQRQRAREELEQFGVAAFEVLHAAQSHPDVEVRKQAEYLLRAIRISWIQEDDPEEVKQLLRGYLQADNEDRLTKLTQLSRLDHEAAIAALCRLARFETSDVLSRRAALALLRRNFTDSGLSVQRVREVIEQVIGTSDRAAARWMLLHAATIVKSRDTSADWRAFVSAELEEANRRPDKERIAVTRDLLRWRIETMQALEQDDEMLSTMQQLISTQGSAADEIQELADWVVRRKAWPLLEMLIQFQPKGFDEVPVLMYHRADLLIQQQKPDQAEALVQRILAKDDENLHLALAFELQSQGRLAWAEREYRHVIATAPVGTHVPLEATVLLGEFFHDQTRHGDAYQTLKVLVDLMEQDKSVVRRVQEVNRVPNKVRSQMHFSHALMLGEQKQTAEQRQALLEALKFDPENADILIAMHRVPDTDDVWQLETKQKIDRLRELYEQHVTVAQRDFDGSSAERSRRLLAANLNQLAWLISNTYGDFELAVKYSQRSLELWPDSSGFLDTLGRCYYAAKDYENAVRYQRRAVELDPYSGQIRKQLDLFEKTLATQVTAGHTTAGHITAGDTTAGHTTADHAAGGQATNDQRAAEVAPIIGNK